MHRSARIFLAALYGILFIPATYIALIVYGLSAMDAGPHLTPYIVSFIALPITFIVSCFGEIWAAARDKQHMRNSAALFFAILPWIVVVLIALQRFAQ